MGPECHTHTLKYIYTVFPRKGTAATRVLFISALPQCGDYSRAVTIRSTDFAATIYFSATAMRRLFEGGYYSKYRRRGLLFISALRNAATIRNTDVAGYYLFQRYRNAATIRSIDVAATIYFSSTAMWRLFEGGYYLVQLYRNVATIRGWLLFEVRRLFEGIRYSFKK